MPSPPQAPTVGKSGPYAGFASSIRRGSDPATGWIRAACRRPRDCNGHRPDSQYSGRRARRAATAHTPGRRIRSAGSAKVERAPPVVRGSDASRPGGFPGVHINEDFLSPDKVHHWSAAFCARAIADLYALFPRLRLVFCSNRKTAAEWTRSYFAAVWAVHTRLGEATDDYAVDSPMVLGPGRDV